MSDFIIDTHVHTSEVSPCGRMDSRELVSRYKEAGYKALIITDHFSLFYPVMGSSLSWREKVDQFFTGYEMTKTAGQELGLLILPGFELTFDNDPNDYLVYGVSREWLYSHENITALDIEAFSRLIADTGGLIIQAHPFRPGLTARVKPCVQGVEVYNGNCRHNSRNDKALAHAEEHGLLKTSGSDAHQREDCFRGGMKLCRPISTIEEFISALRREDAELIMTD